MDNSEKLLLLLIDERIEQLEKGKTTQSKLKSSNSVQFNQQENVLKRLESKDQSNLNSLLSSALLVGSVGMGLILAKGKDVLNVIGRVDNAINDHEILNNQDEKESGFVDSEKLLKDLGEWGLKSFSPFLGVYEGVQGFFSGIFSIAKEKAPMLIHFIPSFLQFPSVFQMGLMSSIGGNVMNKVNQLSNWISGNVIDSVQNVKSFVGDVSNRLLDSVTSGFNKLATGAKGLLNRVFGNGSTNTPADMVSIEGGSNLNVGNATGNVQSTSFPFVFVYADVNANSADNFTGYDSVLVKAYSDLGIDKKYWQLLKSQISQESNFNLYAKSHAGATGLTQFMPQTAKSVFSDMGAFNFMSAGNLNVSDKSMLNRAVYASAYSQAKYMFNIIPNEIRRVKSKFNANVPQIIKDGLHIGSLFTAYNQGVGNLIKGMNSNNADSLKTGSMPRQHKDGYAYWSKIYKTAGRMGINPSAKVQYRLNSKKTIGGLGQKVEKDRKSSQKKQFPRNTFKTPSNSSPFHSDLTLNRFGGVSMDKFKNAYNTLTMRNTTSERNNISVYHLALIG